MRAREHLFVTCFVCSLAVLGARPCFAGPDALTDKAATLYDEGMAAYSKSKWAEARASFLAAWSLKNHWQIAGSLGDSEVQLGLFREAAAHIAYFLRLAPPERRSAAALRLYDVARSKVGTLAVTVNVAGADVAVDGNVIGKAPLEDPVFVDPGHHQIEARSGAKIATAQVDVLAGESRSLALAPSAASGPVVPVPSAGLSKPVLIAGGTATGVGVVLGAVFAGLSHARASDAATKNAALVKLGPSAACSAMPSTSCQAVQTALRDQATFANVAAWSFIGAGVVGAGTVVYALVAPRAPKASGMGVVPLVAREGGGVVLRGVW